ncbi:hypothetical protein D9613_007758 [Agrocybe pediades]|uniref:Metallo-beta-lactamase domain-containing protein n=1 Tax=Agrocybe pediades TaxID=84607 RepID=A0A8H4VMX5_9AGAR|nr:hypothetical protein D9613_007758 [Agrocybe pediades]
MYHQPPRAAFRASRLTPTTFLIKEYDDVYSEHPHIYVKVDTQANTILIIDTGCGGKSNDQTIEVKSLRRFIETVAVDDNNGLPLNKGANMKYIIALTHCHYDHILAVEDFKDSIVLASGHSPSFLDKNVMPEHSLCKNLGINTPIFASTLVPHLYDIVSSHGGNHRLGVTILHTPGHTPDEIALYDEADMMLYVGDTIYEWEPTIFPKEGSIVTWFSSMDFLIAFVKGKNEERKLSTQAKGSATQVLVNSGHQTALQPAVELLLAAKDYMQEVLDGKRSVTDRRWNRGEETVSYGKTGDRFSLRCPARLIREAREGQKITA